MIDRAIGIAGLALGVLSLVLPTAFPKMDKRWAVGGLVLGLLMLGGAAAIALQPVTSQGQSQISGNCNAVGNNNSNCSINNFGLQKLQADDAKMADLLSKLPIQNTITVHAIGSQSDWAVALQIARFLKSNGYSIRFKASGVYIPSPDRQLTWIANQSELLVAPSVQE